MKNKTIDFSFASFAVKNVLALAVLAPALALGAAKAATAPEPLNSFPPIEAKKDEKKDDKKDEKPNG